MIYPERTTDHGQATGKLYHLQLRVECTFFVIYKAGHEPRWFSPGTPASSTTKTGRHDIAESGVKHNKSNQSNQSDFGDAVVEL
jgi:hypothetical protein